MAEGVTEVFGVVIVVTRDKSLLAMMVALLAAASGVTRDAGCMLVVRSWLANTGFATNSTVRLAKPCWTKSVKALAEVEEMSLYSLMVKLRLKDLSETE